MTRPVIDNCLVRLSQLASTRSKSSSLCFSAMGNVAGHATRYFALEFAERFFLVR